MGSGLVVLCGQIRYSAREEEDQSLLLEWVSGRQEKKPFLHRIDLTWIDCRKKRKDNNPKSKSKRKERLSIVVVVVVCCYEKTSGKQRIPTRLRQNFEWTIGNLIRTNKSSEVKKRHVRKIPSCWIS